MPVPEGNWEMDEESLGKVKLGDGEGRGRTKPRSYDTCINCMPVLVPIKASKVAWKSRKLRSLYLEGLRGRRRG